ncbi:OLC1v1035742C1 [Oldenlandia corymbosa var. corymbosa]|uniref:OLC1v1035742C1 n=1 Tax=Oldenlandia corymbosa var. corymbosa TaxID=529605 RepID=A0AAV1CWV0_OLDCO|nr:OLC1v1035742C1 [Oldenlandia corymbosa var. corymbosa]
MATDYPNTPSATNIADGHVPMWMLFVDVVTASIGTALLLNHYSYTESVVSKPAGLMSMIAESVKTLLAADGTTSIPTAQIVLSTDRLAETLLVVNRIAEYASVIADSVVIPTTAVERSPSAAETVGAHDQKQ